MRRCRVVGCFASSTQQMNSFRPSGVRFFQSSKTFGSDRTAARRSSPASWTVPCGKAFATNPPQKRCDRTERRRSTRARSITDYDNGRKRAFAQSSWLSSDPRPSATRRDAAALAGTVPTTGDGFRVMPIALSDDQLSVVFQHAEKLSPADRGQYLHRATALLPDVEAQTAPVLRGTDAKSAAAAFV